MVSSLVITTIRSPSRMISSAPGTTASNLCRRATKTVLNGNGISLIIMIGIVARAPHVFSAQVLNMKEGVTDPFINLFLLILMFFITFIVVFILGPGFFF